MKRLSLVSLLSLMTVVASFGQQPTPTPSAGRADQANAHNADNTAHNSGGQGTHAATADKQSNDKADLASLQKIRQAVVGDGSLSFNAKNAKIMVNSGVATLRGPVENEQEKTAVAAKAAGVVGKDKVKNELEVKARK